MKYIVFSLFLALSSIIGMSAEAKCSQSFGGKSKTQIEPSFEEQAETNGEGFRFIFHFKEPVIKHAPTATVKLGPGVRFTGNHSHAMCFRNASFIELTFEAPAEHMGKEVELYIIHLAALVDGVHRNAPVDMIINGKPFLNAYDPLSAGWVYDKFDITDWVVEGTNTIRIQMLDGICQYWLNSLFITFKNPSINK